MVATRAMGKIWNAVTRGKFLGGSMLNKKDILFLILVLLIFCANSVSAKVSIGLWVECEGSKETLTSLKKINRLLSDAKDMGVTDLFIQVYRGSRSWCNSSFADTTPYKQFKNKEGIDAIQYIIEKSRESGIKVHLWINIFRILRDKNAPIVREFGTKIVTRDRKKRLLFEYPEEDLPDGGYWVDPGDLQVQGYMLKLVSDIIEKYPECDGIHLDYIRYPYRIPFYPESPWASGRGFGYGVESVKRFMHGTGINPFGDLNREEQQAWDDWKREQVTDFIRKLYPVCKKANKTLSAAVICWADRAYLSAYQDWRGWLQEGIIDFAASMNYSIDRRFARYLSREAIASRESNQTYVGLGAYLLTDKPEVLSGQIDDAVQLGANGIVIFSYDAIASSDRIKNIIKSKSRQYNK